MRIDIRPIAKQPGSSMELKLEFSAADIDIKSDECDIDGLIGFEGSIIMRDEDTCVLMGDLNAQVQSFCGRCGEHVVFKPEAKVEAIFRSVKQSQKNGLMNNTEDEYAYNGFSLVPDEAFRDSLLLGIPAKILCDEDCKGLCAGCGRNLNEGPCNCGG